MIGKIERLPLRSVWKHEANDFTVWLEDNLEELNDILDFNLSNVEREKAAGDFSVDLVAEDDSGSTVVIENQLEKSNHDHLGKIITYLTCLEARAAIWIVSDPRPEHVAAISWLNESTSASFYLIKVEAVKIGESDPAPLLTPIVAPSEEGRKIGETKKERAERYVIRRRFWQQLLDYARTKTKLHANISPSGYGWIGTGAGISGLAYNYTVKKHETIVEIYIDRGKDNDEENKRIFDELAQNKEAIEAVFSEPLVWQRLDGKRACRIKKEYATGGYRDDEKRWPAIHEGIVDAMIRLEKALSPYIKQLSV